VQVLHKPTGIIVSCQQERSQHQNRAKALKILYSKLLEIRRREEAAQYADTRRNQIGTGDRSERIRTYNFPQNRVTDHRFGLSWYNLPQILEGDLMPMLEDILAEAAKQALKQKIDKARNEATS
ncbi:MAG: peptide chain release factor 1, partial [Lentisphaerae bacterium]